jgi:hypothetical protein
MKTARYWIFFMVVLTACAAASDNDFNIQFSREKILAMLTNQDVDWQGDYSGLVPYLSPNATAILPATDEVTVKKLRSWLGDPNRFVIAHVLLSLSQEGTKYRSSGSEWNTLRVKILAGGHVQYDPSQMEAIQQMWASLKPLDPSKGK